MGNAKHTPGPWRVFNGTDVFPDDGDREATRHIADCDMPGNIGGDEQRANARLISAAPDLLEALTALVDIDENGGPFGGELYRDRVERAFDAARAGIAKATA